MKKPLPKIKKSLKSFILDEDAKVIDKTATKIAISASFLAFSALINSDDANALFGSHKNHSNHSNHLKDIEDDLLNEFDTNQTRTFSAKGHAFDVEMTNKSVSAAHGNHYNHVDGGGSS